MGLARIQRGERFWFKDSAWEISRVLPERAIMARNLNFGHETTVTWEEISKAWRLGDLRFEVKGRAARAEPDSVVSTQYQCVDFGTLDEKYREAAKAKYRLIQPLLDMPRGTRTKRLVIDHLQTVRQNLPIEEAKLLPESYQTVYELMSAFESSGRDIRALVPQLGRRKRTQSEASRELLVTIDAVLEERWLTEPPPSLKWITELVTNQVAHDNKFRSPPVLIPQEHALYVRVWRRAQELDAERVKRAQQGDRAADHAFGPVGESPKPTRILQVAQIDHTRLDLFVVDERDAMPVGRPRLTFCLDVFSAEPMGFDVGFEPPSTLAVGRCLRNAILPKDEVRSVYESVVNEWLAFGVPETLIVDNGFEFIGKSMEDASLQLGMELIQAPIRNPEFKGAVERFFGTLNKQLLHALPGTSFSNILQRGDYDPAKNAVIGLEAFMEILHIFLVDYYSQRPNRRGVIPDREWARSAHDYPPALPWNKDDLNILLGAYVERTLGRQGIEFECLRFNAPSLAGLRAKLNRGRAKEPVKFKYDPADLSRVWVYDRFEEQWLEVPCTDQEYASGLSIWKHRVIKRYTREDLQQEVDYVALATAKAKIQAIVDREWSETKRIASRQKMKRWYNGGFDSTRFETTPIEESSGPELNEVGIEEAIEAEVERPQRSRSQPQKRQSLDEATSPEAALGEEVSVDDDLDLQEWGPVSLRIRE